ncbi:MAG: hypothetical protein M3Z57_07390 [Candidatus Dormibacteraeota bacterium]|nr:hypothetical protein [Candidatus Dormibacteraeota bacterium]
MDPTGLLDAVLAVAVYPGVAFLAVAALLHGWLAGRRTASVPPGPVPAASVLPVLAAAVATAMLPMVGAPALRLPPTAGVAGNAVVVTILLAVAVDLGGGARRLSALAAAAALPIVGLAAAGGTVSVVAISTAGGSAALAARVVAATLLVLAGSLSAAGRAASAVSAALALAGAALVIPQALHDAPPIMCALASLGVVAVSGGLARWRDRWTVLALSTAGIAGAVVATSLALLSSRA